MAVLQADTDYYAFEDDGVSFKDFDLNRLLSFEDFTFFGDVELIVDGRSFEDVVGYIDNNDDGVSFAGSGIDIVDQQMVSGTVEAIDIDDWDVGLVAVVHDVSLAATEVMSAMLSATFADDFALWTNAFSGADVFRLAGGNDDMRGFGGNDRMFGKAGDDTLAGNEGNDIIRGVADDDWLFGQAGADSLFGGTGDDVLSGGRGQDKLYGGGADDRMNGDAGADLLVGEKGDDILRGGAGRDELQGKAADDTLFGGAGKDILRGDAKEDRLFGGGQDDDLYGGSARDLLNGGAGSDDLYGGGGRDNFLFNANAGTDSVHDFEAGLDRIWFKGTADDAASDLSFSQDGDWLVINHAGGQVRVQGVTEDDVADSWFVFA